MRTLQRWKQSYRLNGINDITSKRRGHPPKRKIPSHITKLIELYRKQYRWGSEVIQAHLLHDHSIQINRYLIDRFLHESGLKKQYPCTTSKKLKTKKKKGWLLDHVSSEREESHPPVLLPNWRISSQTEQGV